MMLEPSYADGVTSKSVSDMMDDIYKCLTQRSMHVKMPVPLAHTGPIVYMEFIDENGNYPSDLNIRPSRTVGTDSVSASISSRARFNIRDASMASDSGSIDKGKHVTMEIDDALQRFSGVIESSGGRSVRSVSRSTISKQYSNNDESEEDDMQDVDDEPVVSKPVKKPFSTKATSTASTNTLGKKNVEIKIGNPASRSRMTS